MKAMRTAIFKASPWIGPAIAISGYMVAVWLSGSLNEMVSRPDPGSKVAEETVGGTESGRVTSMWVWEMRLADMSTTAPSYSWIAPGTPRVASCAGLRVADMVRPAAVLDAASARVRLADSPRMVIPG